MVEENGEKKEWSMWIDTDSRIISMKKIPNAKKKVFDSEEAMVEFGALLVFKGYKMG